MARKMTCAYCDGENVWRDATAVWDEAKQEWVLGNVFDYAHCDDCDGQTTINEEEV